MKTTPYLLSVENSQLWTAVIQEFGQRHGLPVVRVRTVSEALARVADAPPRAVIASLELPDFSAGSLVAALKADADRRSIPIAVLTSSERDERIYGLYQPDRVIRKDQACSAALDEFIGQLIDESETAADAAPGRILLVEDSAALQRLAGKLLHLAGYEVSIADHGRHALEILEHSSFDLVLMDIEMPELDGRQTIRQLRGQGFTTPVVALTGHDTDAFRQEATELGFNGVCPKPIQRDTLLETCERYLRTPVE